ncbi:metallophosphoesterase [Rhizobium phaseoli]|uniref:Calcineurin-like phosphoesterase domain-containing protein n=1 Tax=Rhizobium phaseoli TaxID=396 RepID=A0ABM6CFN5_9HYPH|nr:metallophosphoesterase [Rhizobium phaseoli]ANL87080.1 calcineurin-like phosphoesterase domain-containing protein [Rhizobium phaseoli]ANL93589.1 calcineurin-like phosphoesterase domain-containing protein [Rhizobium phaseoli]
MDTVKAAVFSDLHLSYNGQLHYPFDLPDDVEIAIVAGDVSAPVSISLQWLHNVVSGRGRRDVVFVAGNHEHYGQVYEKSMSQGMEDRAKFPHIHFLENEAAVIKGVRFLGATMWTDFNLFGYPAAAMEQAAAFMNDYSAIRSRAADGNYRRFTPEITRAIHQESREWLRQALAESFHGPTVVVTHTSPHIMSVSEEYADDPLTPAFASDFGPEIAEFEPEFWIHGHTHTGFDYIVPGSRTRVVCNPLGYRKSAARVSTMFENLVFDPYKTIEIPLAWRPLPGYVSHMRR